MANQRILKGFPTTVNGDNVIAYTSAKTFRTSLVEHDLASLGQWYHEDPDKNNLGMVQLMQNIINYPMPMYAGLLQSGSIINVNGPYGTFRYSLPVTETHKVVTVMDTSDMFIKPGIDGQLFELVLDSGEYTANDVLTYDATRGCDVIVSGERTPKQEAGSAWRYWVRMVSNGRATYFPKDKLRRGIQYFKIGHALSEFDTQFSKVTGMSQAGSMQCEFRLGNHRGVEGETTMYAGQKLFSFAMDKSTQFIEDAYRNLYNMSKQYGFNPEMAIIGNANQGNLNIRTAKVAATLEIFCLAELMKLENRQLIFQRGGTIQDANGVKYLNEGLYHQLRRGFTIQYGRPGGITRNHIAEAVEYAFRGSSLPYTQRRIKFKCGKYAYQNLIYIFRDEFLSQVEGLRNLIGRDMLIKNPISGPNDALVLNPVEISGVYLPDIGLVQVEHDPSLDYVDLADRSTFINGAVPYTAYSCIIEDITSSEFTNAYSAIPDTSEARISNPRNNVFYVKPEGPSMWWGHQYGRYASNSNGRDIVSSLQGMKEQFWCHSQSAVWVRDLSRFVMIELNEAA